MTTRTISIVDLFAGIGGLRQGVENAIISAGNTPKIVFTSEIKKTAIKVLQENWSEDAITGDITQVNERDIPRHDLLLAGFPCQAFSFAGKREGFADTTKGTLFFDVARVLAHHKPKYFILENVEGLVTHDPIPGEPIGRTFNTILTTLTDLGYSTSWAVLTATDFGVPQLRKRIFITGVLDQVAPDLNLLSKNPSLPLSHFIEQGIQDTTLEKFETLLLQEYDDLKQLVGKIFRDWRGGARNIHSWNLNFKGETSLTERNFLEILMKESKKSHWVTRGRHRIGEGFPLSLPQIRGFYDSPELETMTRKLTKQGYLKEVDSTYRISSGKLTMPVSHLLDTNGYANTLVATDADRLAILDGDHIRRFTTGEVKSLFGFPQDFQLPEGMSRSTTFDLFGNSVVVPVAQAVAQVLLRE